MIVVISGTNRPGCNTLKVAEIIRGMFGELDEEVQLLNLQDLPPEIFDASSYAEKPGSFATFQRAVLEADGILTVIPEYNGSLPGVMKYFIDMLKFPESLKNVPAAFVGLGAGEWGGLRGVEQLEMIFQYRSAHLYGRRVFLRGITKILDDDGQLTDSALEERLRAMVAGFATFCASLRERPTGAG